MKTKSIVTISLALFALVVLSIFAFGFIFEPQRKSDSILLFTKEDNLTEIRNVSKETNQSTIVHTDQNQTPQMPPASTTPRDTGRRTRAS